MIDIKPVFDNIQQKVTTSLVGTATYDSALAYDSLEPYGGISGGQTGGPRINPILTQKPNENNVINVRPNNL